MDALAPEPTKDVATDETGRGVGASVDPSVSEWGNPAHVNVCDLLLQEGTRGTETSQYPEEKKESIDSVSSGERTRRSPNQSNLGL